MAAKQMLPTRGPLLLSWAAFIVTDEGSRVPGPGRGCLQTTLHVLWAHWDLAGRDWESGDPLSLTPGQRATEQC